MSKNYLFAIVVFFFSALLVAAPHRCPVCGMSFGEKAKTRVEATLDQKPVVLCSFACAHKLRKKGKTARFLFHDFATDETVDANQAFFLAKSQKLVSELDFNMPPSVAAFKTEAKANETQKRLGDGTVVKGFQKLEEIHE